MLTTYELLQHHCLHACLLVQQLVGLVLKQHSKCHAHDYLRVCFDQILNSSHDCSVFTYVRKR